MVAFVKALRPVVRPGFDDGSGMTFAVGSNMEAEVTFDVAGA